MRKSLFLVVLMLFSITTLQAQNVLKNDTLFLAKGGYLVKGGKMDLGKGARDNGAFKHIEVNAASMLRVVGNSNDIQGYNSLSNQFNDLDAKIVSFSERGTKKTGKKYVVIIAVGSPARYQVDIDNAIEDGEVILPEYKKTSKNLANNSISATDELKKLKDLFDAEAITEAEYKEAKAKILEKM